MKSKLTLNIMNKDFHLGCESSDKSQLLDAAQLVNTKIDEIKSHGKTVGTDRIALMAALNLASDLIKQNQLSEMSEKQTDQTVSHLLKKIEHTLDEFKQLNFS